VSIYTHQKFHLEGSGGLARPLTGEL